jgi:hypothetical protein
MIGGLCRIRLIRLSFTNHHHLLGVDDLLRFALFFDAQMVVNGVNAVDATN